MNLVDAYKQLLKNTHHILKKHGYSRKASIFYKKYKDNWGIIGFQKSGNSNNKFEIKFTINLGVYSEAVAELLDPAHIKLRPAVWDFQWGRRIGYLLPYADDKWWVLDEETSMELLEQEIQDCLLYKAIPEINKCILNSNLLELWVLNQLPGLGIMHRQIVLASPDYMDRLNLLRTKKIMKSNSDILLGTWIRDPEDVESIQRFGNVKLHFTTDGQLIYTILGEESDQKILLTYRVEKNVLVINQLLDPKEEHTNFRITHEGKLEWECSDGRTARYVRFGLPEHCLLSL